MATFNDGAEVELLSLNNILGLAAGVGHPDQDAPADMPVGSRYYRSDGSRYTLLAGVWVVDEQQPPTTGLPRLKYRTNTGLPICLLTNTAGLPYTLSTGSTINLPLNCI